MPKLLVTGHEVYSNNIPQEEAEELVENLEVKNAGHLFENAKKMDKYQGSPGAGRGDGEEA